MFTDIRKKRIDGRTDAGEIPPRKTLLPAALMIREQYAKVSYTPSAYSYRGNSMWMVAIYGPVFTHRAPGGSYMQRELYAALHYNLQFIDSQVYAALHYNLQFIDSQVYAALHYNLQFIDSQVYAALHYNHHFIDSKYSCRN